MWPWEREQPLTGTSRPLSAGNTGSELPPYSLSEAALQEHQQTRGWWGAATWCSAHLSLTRAETKIGTVVLILFLWLAKSVFTALGMLAEPYFKR